MHISPIQNRLYNNFSFQRRPRKGQEAEDYQKTIEKGFEVAGVKERIAITHGSVFPSVKRDSFIGSPYGEGAKEWINFLILNGFNGNQLGPNGELSGKNISPYNSSALNENPLFLDLKLLTTKEYGKLLTNKTYEYLTAPIKKNNPKNYTFTNFNETSIAHYLGFNEAYNNFKQDLKRQTVEATQLNKEFIEFKESKGSSNITKGQKTEEEGLYKILVFENQTEDLSKWDPLDANLIAEKRKGNPKAIAHYEVLKKEYSDAIERYQFEQFLITKQIKENKDFRDEHNFKYFSDLLVGCSKMDYWRYKDAFLDDYKMGSFEHGNTPYQLWSIPVINPRKLFLGPNAFDIGGVFLTEKIEHALENCENIRIDHVLGLIEPFIYKESTVKYDDNGKQIKSEIYGNFVSKLPGDDGRPLDDYGSYPQILERIVLPILKRHNLKPQDAVWETICCEPDKFKEVYYGRLNLPRIVQTEYSPAEKQGNENWFLVGSHDSNPAINMLRQDGGNIRNQNTWDAQYLAGYLHQDPARAKERDEFCQKIANSINGIPKLGNNLAKADKELIKAKFAELFTKEKVMVSFADILGITDKNIVYNIGGDKNDIYWKLRIAPDFINKYYDNLSSDNPTALNIPEVLKIAVQAKLDMQIAQSQNKDATRKELYEKYTPLIEKLDYYAEMLKEKE